MIKRETFWNAASMETYADATLRKKRAAVDRHDGKHIALDLENIWNNLSEEEKLLIEYLVLSDRPSLVALYENQMFVGLVAKGLLQTPPGVGTLFMQYLQTTYTIPLAVWRHLRKSREALFPLAGKNEAMRLEELSAVFESQIDALLKGPSIAADTHDNTT